MLLRYLVAAFILILFSFITFRVIVRNDYSKKGRLTFVSTSLEFLIFALHANFMYLFLPVKWPNIPSIPENVILRIISIVFIIIGFLIVAISMSGLGYNRTMGQDKKLLKTNGLYKYSRNPQLVGYGMILIAFVLLYLSWFSIFLTL
jgi:protein-S-isoprenylcysteine O-methyltransferase Ste14